MDMVNPRPSTYHLPSIPLEERVMWAMVIHRQMVIGEQRLFPQADAFVLYELQHVTSKNLIQDFVSTLVKIK